jgi:anti-anti-sigma factor
MDEREMAGGSPAVRRVACEDGEHLHLEGVVGVRAAQHLQDVARQALAAPGGVTVNFARAEYLDGAALQILLALGDGLRQQGRELHLVSVPASIEEMLRLTGLAEAFRGGRAS